MTQKKIVRVEDKDKAAVKTAERAEDVKDDAKAETAETKPAFEVTAESKKKAAVRRWIAVLLWVIAIGLEVVAILLLRKPPINMILMIALIVGDLAFAIVGSLLWKKANRFDPASEKEKVRFFVQNQLGAIISVIAFLPLVILVFTNQNLNGKQKGIVGAIAIVALLAGVATGIDWNPVSIEQYEAETKAVEDLMGQDLVYWTEHGGKYHLYSDCQHINRDATKEIFEGTVAQAHEDKNITELCKTCEGKAQKAKDATAEAEAPEDEAAATLPAGIVPVVAATAKSVPARTEDMIVVLPDAPAVRKWIA